MMLNQTKKEIGLFLPLKCKRREACIITGGFPFSIKYYFGLKPRFCYSLDLMTSAVEGYEDFDKRIFLSSEEKDEMDKFEDNYCIQGGAHLQRTHKINVY